MTVAVSVDAVFADLGSTPVVANALQGADSFSAAATTPLSSSTTISESFRSNLLASLGTGTSTLSGEGAGTDEASAVAGSSQTQTTEDVSSAASPMKGGSTLSSGLTAVENGSLVSGAAAKSSAIGSQKEESLASTVLSVSPQAVGDDSTSIYSTNSSGKKDGPDSGKSAKRDTVTNEAATAQIATQATASADALAMTTPVVDTTLSIAAAVETQSGQTHLATTSSTGIAQAAILQAGISQSSFCPHSQISDSSGSLIKAADSVRNQAADMVETAVLPVDVSPASASGYLSASATKSSTATVTGFFATTATKRSMVATAGSSTVTAYSRGAVAALDGNGTSTAVGTMLSSTDERATSSNLTEAPSQTLAQNPFQAQFGSQGTANSAASVIGTITSRVSQTSNATTAESISASLDVDSAGLASDRQATGQTVPKSSRGAVTVEATGRGSHSQEVVTAGSSTDAAVWLRDTESVREAANAVHEVAGSSLGASAGQTSSETFAALDADTGTGTPTWIHAGAQHAEAGFQDATLGWVGVRADVSGGGVHASLVSGSAEAAQILSGHLAGLNTYLAEQHTPVETLTLATAGSSGNDLSADQGSNSGSYQGTGQNSGQGVYANSQQGSPVATVADSAETAAQIGIVVPAATRRGAYISVMA